MRRVRQTLNTSLVFACIPNRDFLVAWTPDFAQRRAFATQIAQDFRARPHPLADALFASADSVGFDSPTTTKYEITAAESETCPKNVAC